MCVGLVATSVFAQAPDSVGGKVYHEYSYPLQDYVFGDLSTTTSVTSLRYDGTYSTILEEFSQYAPGFPETGTRTIRPPDSGTYVYAKTSANTATLTLTSTKDSGVVTRTLSFVSASGGILAGALFPGGTGGNFSLSSIADVPVVNMSARGTASASKPLILGFYVSGRPRFVLARAIGPTLASFDVPDPAEDVTIEIVPTRGPLVGPITAYLGGWNDDWETEIHRSLAPDALLPATTVGAFMGAFALPKGSKDAAIAIFLQTGSHTAVIRTKSETPAEVLGEIYIVP